MAKENKSIEEILWDSANKLRGTVESSNKNRMPSFREKQEN